MVGDIQMILKLQQYICEDSAGDHHYIDAEDLENARYQFDKYCAGVRKLVAIYQCVYQEQVNS
jgi:hypothetical protein